MTPKEMDEDPQVEDMFAEPIQPASEHHVSPSESVYCDQLDSEELLYIGEVQLPRPVPVELTIEVDGWDYVYRLDRRAKS